ncbi:MAG: SCO family protein [Chloroflexota bacterium]
MRRQRIPASQILFAPVLLTIAVTAFAHELQRLPMERREVRVPINNFTATDQSGRSFEFKSLRGKVVIVTFAYTSCPDICPLITAAARQVQSRLSSVEHHRVQLLTVTTDPQIDAPKILAAYAARYNVDLDNWSFLTGSEQALGKIWKNFGVGVKHKARGLVDHTPLTAIVDKNGFMRVAYIGASPDARLVLGDVRRLLGEL